MAATVRELNFKIITFVTIIFICALVTTVSASVAWFRNEVAAAKTRTWAPDAALMSLNAQQLQQIEAPESGVDIESAMRIIADTY